MPENIYQHQPDLSGEMHRLADLATYANVLSTQAIGHLEPGMRLLELGGGPDTKLMQHYARMGVECHVMDIRWDALARHGDADNDRVSKALRMAGWATSQKVFIHQTDVLNESLVKDSDIDNFPPGYFNAVHARALLAYGAGGARTARIGEIYDLLAPGGRFVDVDNVWSSVLSQESEPFRGIARLALQVQGFQGNYGAFALQETQLAWRDKGSATYAALRMDFQQSPGGYQHVLPLETPIVIGSRMESVEMSEQAAAYFAQMRADAALEHPPALAHPSMIASIAIKHS
jgi:SAM-dependent methyltransferase